MAILQMQCEHVLSGSGCLILHPSLNRLLESSPTVNMDFNKIVRIFLICAFLPFPNSEQCNKKGGTASISVSNDPGKPGIYNEGISDPGDS